MVGAHKAAAKTCMCCVAMVVGDEDATAPAEMPCSDLSYIRLIRTGSSACGCFLSLGVSDRHKA